MERWKETISTQFEVLKFKLRRVQPVEFAIAFVIFLIGMILSYREFKDNDNELYFLWLLILVGVILGPFVWIKAINRYFGKFSYYLVEHKYSRKIIAGGSFSYYEYQDPEDQTTKGQIIDPLSQVFTLLLAFVGIAVFIMGFLGEDAAENPLVWGLLAIIVPLIATPLIPVLWSLQATKVKAFASGNNTTWMVGTRYKNRFNSIISIAAIYSNLRDTDAGDLVDQIKILLEVIQVGILVLLIPTSIFIIIYYGWFKEELSDRLRESLTLKTYEVILEEHEMEWDEDDEEDKTMEEKGTAEIAIEEAEPESEPEAEEEEDEEEDEEEEEPESEPENEDEEKSSNEE
jgi:hypothetical protein